jgi:hypothetical protein
MGYVIRHNEFVVNILEGAISRKKAWKDLDYSTYSKLPDTQELTIIHQRKEWLATDLDGKLPTIKTIEG